MQLIVLMGETHVDVFHCSTDEGLDQQTQYIWIFIASQGKSQPSIYVGKILDLYASKNNIFQRETLTILYDLEKKIQGIHTIINIAMEEMRFCENGSF